MTHRRRFLTGLAATAALPALPAIAAPRPLTRPIPRTGERIPAIGMGTWITFNVGASERLRRRRLDVLKTFFQMGGGLVDSSPMYGSAEDVMGWCLKRLNDEPTRKNLISATKIWSPAGGTGPEQLADSLRLWGLPKIDVMQVHNLVDWQAHLETLTEARAKGLVRYIGITTSHGWRHDEMARIMQTQALDFVQFTYNVLDRTPEARLLPLAAEKNIGVIINRPFQRGSLFAHVSGRPLPPWAAEIGCKTWAQFFLKFIVSHPAVTCAIPATTRVAHMRENMAVLTGPLPDPKMRQRMAETVAAL